MRTIERDIVSAILVSKDNKLLQARQKEDAHSVYPGCWAIIGGGVDEGEDQRTALNREFLEETGIDISPYPAELVHESEGEAEKTLRKSGERVHVKMKFHTYRVVINDKDANDVPVSLSEEHTEYRWSDVSELKTLKLTPPSLELFKKVGYL
jgi:8-oxo-dGTP pyrophosphatase MutT (NUDIX family)